MPDDVIAIALGYGRQSADPKNTGAYIGRQLWVQVKMYFLSPVLTEQRWNGC